MYLNHLWKGGLAGLIATLIMSVVMIIKRKIGFYEEFNPIEVITQGLNLPQIIYGWYFHYLIGFIFGIIFSIVYYHIPGEERFRGCVFAAFVWLLMMLTLMPIMGMGFFAINADANVAMFTFIMHLIFGIFLGIIYGFLDKKWS